MLQVGCAWIPRKTETPLPMLIDPGASDTRHLVVLLPGRLTTPREMDREGFTELARQAFPGARIVRPDLHIGYYRNRTAIDRLHEDIILPAQRDGLSQVTLVGISMGGLGAMLYDLEKPGIADELILLSPFLGEAEVISEIDAAGDLKSWKADVQGERDFSRAIWKRIQARPSEKTPAAAIQLGCGTEDRLSPTSRLAERELPLSSEAVWMAGGHDWPTWRALFRKIRGMP